MNERTQARYKRLGAQRGRRAPLYTTGFSLCLPDKLADLLRNEIAERGESGAQIVRRALAEYFERKTARTASDADPASLS